MSGQCEPGFYCPGGSIRSNGQDSSAVIRSCEEGTACPRGSSNDNACLQGSYQPGSNGTICYDCPPGQKCQTNGLDVYEKCDEGNFCDVGTAIPQTCNAGRFSNDTVIWVDRPSNWPASYSPGAMTSSECLSCPVGNLCPSAATTNPELCTPGFACLGSQSLAGTSDFGSDISTQCPAGFMCPAGTGSKFSLPCPLGQWRPNSGEIDCLECPAGNICDKLGISLRPNDVGETWEKMVTCPAKYYCYAGACKIVPTDKSLIPDPTNLEPNCKDRIFECRSGYFCPAGSQEPQQCAAGTFSDRILLEDCWPCDPGYYCPGNDTGLLALAGFTDYEECVTDDNRFPLFSFNFYIFPLTCF